MAERILTLREQQLFVDYLTALQAAPIRYVLLRNYEGFPASVGHDLDLFIPRADVHRAAAIFRDLLAQAGGCAIVVHERDYFTDVRFTVDSPVSAALHLDLFHGSFTWHGLPYLTEQRLLAQASSHGGHPIPRPAHEALNLLFGSILWGGFFKTRYQPRIAELLATPGEREEFDRCVRDAFGATGAPPFDPCSPEHPAKTFVRDYARKLRRAFKLQSLRRAPFTALALLARYWSVEIKAMLHPLGLHLAILGPDGAGKSTLIAGIIARVGELFGERHLHHWRPSVLPDVGVLMGNRETSTMPVVDPHGKLPHPAPVALLRVAYYWLDYWLGWLPLILRRKAQVHLVIFDRYADDIWCDPRRYRFALPQALLRTVAWLTPRPDFTFVLLADAALLAQRKGEIPSDAVAEITARYRTLAARGGRCIALDAAEPVETLLDRIETVIVEYLRQRENGRQT